MTPTNPASHVIPDHLKKYVVDQDYSKYTPVDQAVWRYCMRQLRQYLSEHAHPLYLEGLEKSGIEISQIPDINDMSIKLSKFGWTAVPVSGFIPPAAFMELQSLSILPIAQDIRTMDHILYTPAPDIVHEAAGHAPILVDKKFAQYLTNYASVAKKAILSSEDYAQYEAIRILSDIKEDPNASEEQIAEAETNLEQTNSKMSYVSEAGWLGRMNWWTAEYGLVGDLENPKIFGAGLLSSVGEAKQCLSKEVKKIPLEVECIEYTYDITEQQPQLFVTPDFDHLTKVLNDLALKMSFRIGGRHGLECAIRSKTVNTLQLDTGLQISGIIEEALYDENDNAYFVKLSGPSQVCFQDHQMEGHGKEVHCHGYSTPLGKIVSADKCLSKMTTTELSQFGALTGEQVSWTFTCGIKISGTISEIFTENDSPLMIRFENCKVEDSSRVFFEPEWGVFDLALGSKVISVYGGPADRKSYAMDSKFTAKTVPQRIYTEAEIRLQHLYQSVRDCRESLRSPEDNAKTIAPIMELLDAEYPQDWLLRLEIVELGAQGLVNTSVAQSARSGLLRQMLAKPKTRSQIEEGLHLAAEQ